MWYLEKYTSGVIPTYLVVSIKNARLKPQPSTPMQAFASMRSTPFMEIDDKGREIVQRYESLKIKIIQREEIIYKLDMDKDKEGATLKKKDGSKFLDKRSTQVGGASS